RPAQYNPMVHALPVNSAIENERAGRKHHNLVRWAGSERGIYDRCGQSAGRKIGVNIRDYWNATGYPHIILPRVKTVGRDDNTMECLGNYQRKNELNSRRTSFPPK